MKSLKPKRYLLKGVGSLVILVPGQTYQHRLREIRIYRTDAEALAADGRRVSWDLRRAFNRAIENPRTHER